MLDRLQMIATGTAILLGAAILVLLVSRIFRMRHRPKVRRGVASAPDAAAVPPVPAPGPWNARAAGLSEFERLAGGRIAAPQQKAAPAPALAGSCRWGKDHFRAASGMARWVCSHCGVEVWQIDRPTTCRKAEARLQED